LATNAGCVHIVRDTSATQTTGCSASSISQNIAAVGPCVKESL